MVLRGRRLERRYSNRVTGLSNLTGRRRRVGLFTAQRILPASTPEPRNPQLKDGADRHSAGYPDAPVMTLPGPPEGSRMFETPVLMRAIYLTSDAIVLTLASPFLAAWWLFRVVRKRLST